MDFVVVPLKLLRKTRGAKVETGIAEDNENEDHKSAGLTVVLGASGKETWWKRRDVSYDREKLASKDVLDLIEADLRNLPDIPWQVDVNKHEQLLAAALKASWKNTAPKTRRPDGSTLPTSLSIGWPSRTEPCES